MKNYRLHIRVGDLSDWIELGEYEVPDGTDPKEYFVFDVKASVEPPLIWEIHFLVED